VVWRNFFFSESHYRLDTKENIQIHNHLIEIVTKPGICHETLFCFVKLVRLLIAALLGPIKLASAQDARHHAGSSIRLRRAGASVKPDKTGNGALLESLNSQLIERITTRRANLMSFVAAARPERHPSRAGSRRVRST